MAEVNADTATLVCIDTRDIGKPAHRQFIRYIDIDYGKNLVVTSRFNEPTMPEKDMHGTSSHPARITDDLIAWRITTVRADERPYSGHYKLNRYTGDLSFYDDGMRHSELYKCEVGQKPVRKF